MEIWTAVWICVAVLGGLIALACAAAFVVIVGLLVAGVIRRRAAAAGIDLTDGIDAREWKIISDLVARYRNTATEQRVAVDLVNAAQTSLAASIPRDATGAPVPPVR